MKNMLSFADNNGRRFYATSQDAMNRFSGKQPEIETLVYGGTQQVKPAVLRRIARGVYQSRDARHPY